LQDEIESYCVLQMPKLDGDIDTSPSLPDWDWTSFELQTPKLAARALRMCTVPACYGGTHHYTHTLP